MIEFRPLNADEIECRIGTCNEKGVSLLLYKDARCDMALLDETVGPENWDCEYSAINGYLFCQVGIRCTLEDGERTWVYKQDTGSKSNMEPEKGHASDAFKRACFRWGIGRELYTAPFIWVPKGPLQRHGFNEKRQKWECYDKFNVAEIGYEDGKIIRLKIVSDQDLVVWNMK